MTSDLPRVSTYLEPALKKKLEYIARFEDRKPAAQIRHVLKRHIEEFEKQYGPIEVNGENADP